MNTKNAIEPYVSLEALAGTLHLPQRYLRERATEGTIPALNINGRLRFSPTRVKETLDQMTLPQEQREVSHG